MFLFSHPYFLFPIAPLNPLTLASHRLLNIGRAPEFSMGNFPRPSKAPDVASRLRLDRQAQLYMCHFSE